ncbi:serine/threonine kinase [Gloeomargarita lithophora Alchichica-D10]|uniref:non-specific serine/threonine protein kinase n=1 Tax=Gloeomargarita lithophora Alchichica-D10 TaxID=1188229 RepID=A0A1J0A9T4_9CYAN|nr:serine/threonine-protein kinase [Gloeomargarita lithophora]APB32677.1 serine/threonine kinase [Gloeomargarita lithophora Alchichica-D10]
MKPGEKLAGRYLVVKTLGSGGFGTTYLAQDTQRPGQPACVVKHLKPDSKDEFVLTTARRLFTSEAETLEKLGKYDQIPALLAYFEENGQFYLAQEFIDGHPLGQEIKRGAAWPQDKVIRMLADVLTTLDFVHQNGVIHRDIKPDNLIRRKNDGKLVLIDFGAVKEIQDPKVAAQQRTGATVAIGTVGYAPAEQAQGKPQLASDIYSLGILAICALTGKEPDQLESDPQTGELVWRQGITVSHALGTVLDRMVRYQYSRRYANAGEALAALRSFSLIGTTTVGTPSQTGAAPTPKTQVRRPPTTTTLVPSGGVDGVVWKYGIIAVIALVLMGVLSIPLQSVFNQRVSQVEPTTPASPDTEPPLADGDREYDVPDELITEGIWRTNNTLRGDQRHIYRILSGSTEVNFSWQVTQHPNAVAELFDPYDNLLQSAAQRGSTTLRPEDTPYRLLIGGQPGRYILSLRLVQVEASPSPSEPETPPAIPPQQPINPGLPGR